MNKKIIIPLTAILIVLIAITVILPIFLRPKQSDLNQTKNQTKTTTGQSSTSETSAKKYLTNQSIKQKLPYETNDFRVEYSTDKNKVIITKKTFQADQKVDQWLEENKPGDYIVRDETQNGQDSDMAGNPEINPYLSPGAEPSATLSATPTNNSNVKLITDLLSILLDLGKNTQTIPTNQLTPTPFLSIFPINPTSGNPPNPPNGDLIYYSQCGGSFDSYSLPSVCTLCRAGCGPTTVAMITASYIDNSITPQTIVDLYKQKGYFLGCAGSRYSDAKNALESYGITTTDYLLYSLETIDQVAADFKNYINNGWTIFVLANYCDAGCGHFFWITDVSANNDTWAYDPYYGRFQSPPYNEKSRYPFPKYRVAFGVKK